MKPAIIVAFIILLAPSPFSAAQAPVAPNGIPVFEGYRSWQAVSPSFRGDKGQLRIVLGNPTAISAMRDGTRPFPDGTVLAKLAWTGKKHPKFPVATLPDSFVQVEFMVKDARKYAATGGWGFARFVGNELKPYGKDAGFVQECFGCHTPVKDNDFLFTGFATVP